MSEMRICILFMALNFLATFADNARFLPHFFGVPSTCTYKNHIHRCSFTLTCWLVGGNLQGGCGGENDWLFTCCVPGGGDSVALFNKVEDEELEERESLARTPILWDSSTPATTELEALEPNNICGQPILHLQKRIIGGNEAYFGEFPWQAHIRIAGYQCGGVLVSKWFVLTAAHCVHRARLKDIKIYLGEYDTQNTGKFVEMFPEELHKVTKKILHPNFEFRLTQPDRYDLALLKLSRRAKYRENILPICLPEFGDSFEGVIGVVAGWGKTDTAFGKTGTNILQKAGVPILSDKECLKWHQKKNIHVELYHEMFCAGHSDGHMDACLGDSGGPLIVINKGKWTLAGITSAGFGCAVDHQPGIYHKVAFTSKWIQGVIKKLP